MTRCSPGTARGRRAARDRTRSSSRGTWPLPRRSREDPPSRAGWRRRSARRRLRGDDTPRRRPRSRRSGVGRAPRSSHQVQRDRVAVPERSRRPGRFWFVDDVPESSRCVGTSRPAPSSPPGRRALSRDSPEVGGGEGLRSERDHERHRLAGLQLPVRRASGGSRGLARPRSRTWSSNASTTKPERPRASLSRPPRVAPTRSGPGPACGPLLTATSTALSRGAFPSTTLGRDPQDGVDGLVAELRFHRSRA